MVISVALARQLMALQTEMSIEGHAIALSHYVVRLSLAMLRDLGRETGFDFRHAPPATEASTDPTVPMQSRTFFRMLGFAAVTELDYFEQGEAIRPFDLNSPETPSDLVGVADAVFDLGTSEHVFHTPNLLAHVGRFLKPGGVVVHHTPTNNHMNHGFYQFAPTLYYDYYAANGFTVETYLVNLFKDWTDPVQAFIPVDEEQAGREFHFMQPNDPAMNFFVARKAAGSKIGAIPQQRMYLGRRNG
jgi:SAM-dependent methyltransferase